MASPEPEDRIHFRDVFPVSVPESLNELHGPSRGRFELPRSIYWGPDRHVDMSVPWQVRKAYRHVLRSGSPTAIADLIDAQTLVRIWPTLVLEERISAAWRVRHPELEAPRLEAQRDQ